MAADPQAHAALMVTGQSRLQSSWPVFDDSTSVDALTAAGQAVLNAPNLSVAGGVSISGKAAVVPQVKTGSESDPFAALAVPAASGPPAPAGTANITRSTTLSPGVYPAGMTVSGSAAVILRPGVYVLQGGGLAVSSSASVTGAGVVIVLEPGSASTACGSIAIAGGRVNLAAPDTGPRAGIAVWIDSRCGRASGVTFAGSSRSSITGALYAPAGEMAITGLAKVSATSVVADRLALSGSGWLTTSP